jgi:hypothetical protein
MKLDLLSGEVSNGKKSSEKGNHSQNSEENSHDY